MTLTEAVLELQAITGLPVTLGVNAAGHFARACRPSLSGVSLRCTALGATPLDACKRLLAKINEASVADIERRAAGCAP